MRTITNAQSAIYASALNARAAWAKVEVFSPTTSAWVDLTNYLGYNWVKSVSITEDINSSIALAEVEFHLLGGPQGEITTSPFGVSGYFHGTSGLLTIGDEYKGLTYPHRQIRISLAVTPIDVPPTTSDWMLKFRGRITTTTINGYTVRCFCRDEMGDLADAFIETEAIFGDDAGSKDVEEVIQDILNSWGSSVVLWSVSGDGSPAFDPADSPGWAVKKYMQQRQSVMDAIRVLSDQIGFDLRFRWQNTAADLKLILSEPPRDSPVVQATFGTSNIYPPTVSLSVLNIRNFVRLLYTDKGQNRQSTTAQSLSSQTAYNRRFLEIGEEVTSQIDTASEASDLSQRIIQDLALPKVEIQCDMPLFPNAELYDFYGFLGDGKIVGDYNLGVVSIRHTIGPMVGITSLTCVGDPASRRNWTNAQQTFTPRQSGLRNQLPSYTTSGNLFVNGALTQWTGS